MNLADISKSGVKNPFGKLFDNCIGGEIAAPVEGEYFAEDMT